MAALGFTVTELGLRRFFEQIV
ncbi:hypothethical protein (plasmid) [Ralstonia solanacearum PSI07]|nr:hypothethical protein [Ralstonia solanacearum PSI07]